VVTEREPEIFHTMTEAGSPLPDSDVALMHGLRFARARWALIFAISTALLVPCFWHKRIEAGDLASHTYNAWLAQLIERGQAPGLYLSRQWTNIPVDMALEWLGSRIEFAAAEKIVVSACVLIFFWGAFALVAAASRRAPWFLAPAIAMIAYGWTLQMGFMNYYLSLGLGFFAIALFWRGGYGDYIGGAILMALSLVAHPMGFVCACGIIFYIKLAEIAKGWRRWAVLASSFLAVFTFHWYIVHHFRTQYWETSIFYLMNGTDQLVLYSSVYTKLAMTTLILGTICFLTSWREGKGTPERWRFRTPLELWAVLLCTAALIPELIQLPLYPGPVGFPVSRLTSITAVMALCVLGYVRPRIWHLGGFSILALAFFALLYRDTGTLNEMEQQAEDLVRTMPYGGRVTETIAAPANSRVYFISHMVDRACIGHCFTYSNYEAPFGQFRVRARPGSPLVTDCVEASNAMEAGEYVVQPEDLPMTQIYQCDEKDSTRLCMRELKAGEKNGADTKTPTAHEP
jgi:hypothetical protein